MTFWEAITGKLMRFRSERSDADKTFYQRLRQHIGGLSPAYSQIPGLAIQLRDLIAAAYAGVDSCTNEESLDQLGPYREQFLKMNSRDFLRFSSAFNAEMACGAGLSAQALNLFLITVQESHNLDASFAISWGQLLVAATAAGIDSNTAIQRFRNDQIRPIVAIRNWDLQEQEYWNHFSKDASNAASKRRTWKGFGKHVESMMEIYSRAT